MPNFLETGLSKADILRFFDFQIGRRFWNHEILLANGVQRVEVHQHAKYRQNLSTDCEDIKIFQFFNMAAAAILDFQICEISLAGSVWKAQTRHHSNCRQSRSSCCGDIAFFRIFKMAAAAILDFWNSDILLAIGVERIETYQHAKLRQNRSMGCEDIKFFDFSRWRRLPSWNCLGAYLDHQQWVFGVSYHSTKFGYEYDRCSSFYNINIQHLARLAGKCLFTPLKLGFWAIWSPKWAAISTKAKKRHTFAWVRVIWASKLENVVSGLTCRWVA